MDAEAFKGQTAVTVASMLFGEKSTSLGPVPAHAAPSMSAAELSFRGIRQPTWWKPVEAATEILKRALEGAMRALPPEHQETLIWI